MTAGLSTAERREDLLAGTLLPLHFGDRELATSAVNARRFALLHVLARILRTLWDPWACPEGHLPLLAWAWSVDIWNDAWPLARKRQVVAESRAYHVAKTTVAGYRMALGYVDAELVRAHLPRHGFVAARSTTPAVYDAWLETLPEIRIRTAPPRLRLRAKGFYAGRRGAGSAAEAVLGRRVAELRRDRTVTPLAWLGIRQDAQGRILTEAERLVIPEDARGFKVGGPMRRPVDDGVSGAKRLITFGLTVSNDPFLPNTVVRGLTPVGVAARRIYEPTPGGGIGFVAGRGMRHGPVRGDDGDARLSFSIRLVEPGTKPPVAGRRGSSAGRGRVQRAPYTASLLVHLEARPGRPSRPGRIAYRTPAARVAEALNAIAVSQAARDTLFADFNSTRPLQFRDLDRMPATVRAGVAVRV